MAEGSVLLLVGTKKGGFIFRSGLERRRWTRVGPLFDGWAAYHLTGDPRNGGELYAATTNEWWGADVKRSRDEGQSWEVVAEGLGFTREGDDRKLKRVWHVEPGHPDRPGEVWAGVEPAGLFRSWDGGSTWSEVVGFNDHPTRERWQPGAGGLCLHSIQIDPLDPSRIYAAVSAAGLFRSDDGGASWKPINRGVRADFLPEPEPEVGHCVHKFALARRRPERLYQQNHCGVYRSDDRGETWVDIGAGLPSRFGFALGVHPEDPDTAYVVPLTDDWRRWMPDGQMRVWRTRDAGASWEPLGRGLPERDAYLTVLREGLAVDSADPCGVYVGTSTGQLFASRDGGERWELVVDLLPPILSVAAVVRPV